jgi:hypothetical protein
MIKNKTILISICVGLLGGAGLILASYLIDEEIPNFIQKKEALMILFLTVSGFFASSYISIKLLFKSSIKRKLFVIPIILLCLFSWYSYESGFGWKLWKQITIKKNPYDGVYTYDPSFIKSKRLMNSIRIGKSIKAHSFLMIIDKYTADLEGYQFNTAFRKRGYNICIKDDVMYLRNGSASNYCEIPPEGTLELRFEPAGEGQFICTNCEDVMFPSHWIKVGEMD